MTLRPSLADVIDADFSRRSRACGRRPGVGAGRRTGFRGVGGGGPHKILDFRGGTFTRASSGYYYPTPTTQASAGNNVLRSADDIVDPPLALFEKAATNVLLRSEEFSNAAWTKVGGASVTADVVTAPDGASTADQIDFGAAATDEVNQTFTAADTSTVGGGVWLRVASGTQTVRLAVKGKNGAENIQTVTVTTTWQRFRFLSGNLSTGATTPTFAIRNESGGGAKTIYAWGAHLEVTTGNPTFGSSYIQTVGATATRSADSLTYSSPDVTALNKRFRFKVSLYSDHALPTTRVILSLDGANDEVRFASSSGLKLQIAQGGATKVESNAITLNAANPFVPTVLDVVVDPVAGSVSVTGALTGDGTVTGTAWTWAAPTTLRVGGRVSAANELNGRLSELYAA